MVCSVEARLKLTAARTATFDCHLAPLFHGDTENQGERLQQSTRAPSADAADIRELGETLRPVTRGI